MENKITKNHQLIKRREMLRKILGTTSGAANEDINLGFQGPDRKSENISFPYEKGMHVGYEAFSKKVSVYFRGQRKILPALYNLREEGIKAGEQFCRDNGWEG